MSSPRQGSSFLLEIFSGWFSPFFPLILSLSDSSNLLMLCTFSHCCAAHVNRHGVHTHVNCPCSVQCWLTRLRWQDSKKGRARESDSTVHICTPNKSMVTSHLSPQPGVSMLFHPDIHWYHPCSPQHQSELPLTYPKTNVHPHSSPRWVFTVVPSILVCPE